MESCNIWPLVRHLLLRITFSRFTPVVAWISTLFLFLKNCFLGLILLYRYNTLFYPFIRWWTFGLFPHFNYYNYQCYKRLCTSFCVDMFLFHLGLYVGGELLGHMVLLCVTFGETARLFSKAAGPLGIEF